MIDVNDETNSTPRGKFIVFEGIDGCGKSTQAQMLQKALINLGYSDVNLTNEITNSKLGKLARSYFGKQDKLFSKMYRNGYGDFLRLLISADRHMHVYGKNGIIDQLEKGIHVICDRYVYSTMVYQYMQERADKGTSFSTKEQDKFNTYCAEYGSFDVWLEPDLLIYCSLDAETSYKRITESRQSELEAFEDLENLKQVRKYYGYLFDEDRQYLDMKRNPKDPYGANWDKRFLPIDANRSITEIHNIILGRVLELLGS